jgi:hypothetical protein
MASGSPSPGMSFELSLAELTNKLAAATKADREQAALSGMEKLIHAFVRDNLEDCSDIKYNPQLAKSLLAVEDMSDLLDASRGPAVEYILRKHVRSVVRYYVEQVNNARPIAVTDKAKFRVRMESIGLNIGWSQECDSRRLMPDGNVIVMACLTFALLFLTLRK